MHAVNLLRNRTDDIPNRILRYRISLLIGISSVRCPDDVRHAYEPTEDTHLIIKFSAGSAADD